MSACEAKYFRHLRLGDIVGIYPADAETLPVRLKHNSRGGLMVLAEHFLQYLNHELHSGRHSGAALRPINAEGVSDAVCCSGLFDL